MCLSNCYIYLSIYDCINRYLSIYLCVCQNVTSIYLCRYLIFFNVNQNVYVLVHWPSGYSVRRPGFNPRVSHIKDSKIVLGVSLHNTHHYKVKWSSLGKGVVPFPTSRCSSFWKGGLQITLDYGRQLDFFYISMYVFFHLLISLSLYIYIYIYIIFMHAFFFVILLISLIISSIECATLMQNILIIFFSVSEMTLHIFVTYWPSTQPSIEKQVHPVEDIKIWPWHVDGLNSVQMRRPQVAGVRQTII